MNRLDIKLKDHKHPCDVTLVVKDGKEFHSHRSVLSQASSFFEKLLNSDMKENNEGVIRLEMVPESQMEDILEFIYTGSVQISTQENAENLLELADYLLLSDLKAIAEKYLEEHINTANCVSIYYLAEKYSCQDLIAICRNFIHSNFSSVAESDDFLNLSSHEVEKWISSDEIVIDAEEDVFELVRRWIDHDESQRRVKLRDLFRHVRLTCLSRDFIASNVMTNDLVKEDEDCFESVYLALQWLDRSTDCYISRPHPPRRSLERDVIVVSAKASQPLNFHTHFYLPSTEQWYRLPPMSCQPTSVFSHRGKVFVVTKSMGRSQCYDPDLNLWSPAPWTKLDSFQISERFRADPQLCDVLVNRDEIFFILEERGSAFLSLWRYNIDLNSITLDLDWVGKKFFCAVLVDKVIYVIGGNKIPHSGIKNTLPDSSTYDTKRKIWKEIAPLKQARAGAVGVSKNDEKVFIAGGFGPGRGWLSSCEVYNIATDEWQFIARLTTPRAGGKMVLIDETLYVLGGRVKRWFKDPCNFPDGKMPVECYDEERDKWNDRTTMSIDKIFFSETPEASGHSLSGPRICSVRLFHTALNLLDLFQFN